MSSFFDEEEFDYYYDSDYNSDDIFLDEPTQSKQPKSHTTNLNDSHVSFKTPLPIPQIDIPDPSIAICHSLEQSQELIKKQFGVDPNHLRTSDINGLVIIPIKDLNLIRKDTRNHRIFHHILVFPFGENFDLVHTDFKQSIEILKNS